MVGEIIFGGFSSFFWFGLFVYVFFLTRKKNKDLKFYGVCVSVCVDSLEKVLSNLSLSEVCW